MLAFLNNEPDWVVALVIFSIVVAALFVYGRFR